jgi:hypothetical protein
MYDSNGTFQELQRAVHALVKETELVGDMKTQLVEAVTQLKTAQDALMAAQASIAVHAHSSEAADRAVGGAENELRRWFSHYTTGPGADKWSGYLDAYHRHFDRFRIQERVTMVEVGVQSGGSIEMWRSYFGADKLKCVNVMSHPNHHA